MKVPHRYGGLNSLSYWYPILSRINGIQTPETHFMVTDLPLFKVPFGEPVEGVDAFVKALQVMAEIVGYPCFLRTGETSGKHYWKDTCFLSKPEDMAKHVYELLEFSWMADMLGLADDVWVIRKFIPMESNFVAFDGKMPINKERRFFIKDGAIQCWHPYWLERAFEDQVDDNIKNTWKEHLQELNHTTDEELAFLTEQTLKVAQRFEGYWSVDWAKGQDGTWYLIDMALGVCSFHWDDCPHKKKVSE